MKHLLSVWTPGFVRRSAARESADCLPVSWRDVRMKAAQLLSCANSMFGWLRLLRGRKAGRERDFEWMRYASAVCLAVATTTY